MKKAVFALATAATLGVAALVTPSPAQAWRGGWGPGLAGGLIAGALIGGIASSAYGYGPGYGYYGGPGYGYYGRYAPYYGGYAPAYHYGYVPAYHGRYRSRYYAPDYYGHRYRRATAKPAADWFEASPSPSGKARRLAPRAVVRNPPPKIMVGQQHQAGKRLDRVRNDQTPNPSVLPAPMNAEATRGTATAERPTEAEPPPKAEIPQAEAPKLEPPKAELDSKGELQLAEATALAERLTATAVGPAPSSDASSSTTDSGADTTASISKNIESLTALVLTGLEVGEISDLAGKVVAIDGALPGSSVLLRTAIVAAGAPEIQLKDGQPEPIEALRRGEVSAVILGLVTVEQARAFPKVENFKLFRVPLSPG